jgi:hypothetical protein
MMKARTEAQVKCHVYRSLVRDCWKQMENWERMEDEEQIQACIVYIYLWKELFKFLINAA